MHMAILEQEKIPMHSEKQAQIGALIFDEAFTAVPGNLSHYSNVFSTEYVIELPEYTGINDHAIKLEKSKQPSFDPIYSLGSIIELEILKTYIKTNLVNSFIQLSKSPVVVPILFNRKPDESLRFCVDYWGLNNLTIKNQYPLSLISKLLNRLGQAKQFA